MTEGFKSLIVWQKSIQLVKEVYVVCRKLPDVEQYGLGNQMRRAAVSIPSNIAEGSKRSTRKEYTQFLHIAHGSLAELETQLILLHELYPTVDIQSAHMLSDEVGRMLSTIIKKLHG